MSRQYLKTKQLRQLKQNLKHALYAEEQAKTRAEAAGERRAILEGQLPLGSAWGEAKLKREAIETQIAKLSRT